MPVERRQRGGHAASGRAQQSNRMTTAITLEPNTPTIPDSQRIQPISFRPPSIGRLNDEQLWRVLYLIAGDPPSRDTSPAASLSLVCKKWKAVIDSNPSLWTYIFIDENMTLQRLQMHLARSETDLLHIHFSHLDFDPDKEKHDPERKERRRAFMNHVWENLPRCRHLLLGAPLITLIVLSKMPSHIRLTQLYHLTVEWPSLGHLSEINKNIRRMWMQPITQLDATKIFSNLRSLTVVTEGLTLDGFSWSILIRPNPPLKRLELHIQSMQHQQAFVTTLLDVQHSLEELTLRVENSAGTGYPVDFPILPALRTLRFVSEPPPGWLQAFASSARYLDQLTLDIAQPAVCLGYGGVLGWESYLPPISTLKTLRIYLAASAVTNSPDEEAKLVIFLSNWLNRLLSLTTLTFVDYRKRSGCPKKIKLTIDPMLYDLARQGPLTLRIRNLNLLNVVVSPPALARLVVTRCAAAERLGLPATPWLNVRMTEFQGYSNIQLVQRCAELGLIFAREY
jgi:hypothetical protein